MTCRSRGGETKCRNCAVPTHRGPGSRCCSGTAAARSSRDAMPALGSIPKGEYGDDETAFDAARREFTEELGLPVPDGQPLPLGDIVQKSGKVVTAWAVEGDLDPETITPGTFIMQWPPTSGREQEFPEIDRVAWFGPDDARARMIAGQQPLVDRLLLLPRGGRPGLAAALR